MMYFFYETRVKLEVSRNGTGHPKLIVARIGGKGEGEQRIRATNPDSKIQSRSLPNFPVQSRTKGRRWTDRGQFRRFTLYFIVLRSA